MFEVQWILLAFFHKYDKNNGVKLCIYVKNLLKWFNTCYEISTLNFDPRRPNLCAGGG